MLATQFLALAQLDQRLTPGQGPVTGHERVSQENPPGKIAGHLQQVSGDLIRGGKQVGHLPRRLQAFSQATETAAAAQVEHRARAQRQFVLR
ncbi:hypothetical protein D3C80_1973730 [compost metagenome]